MQRPPLHLGLAKEVFGVHLKCSIEIYTMYSVRHQVSGMHKKVYDVHEKLSGAYHTSIAPLGQ